MGEGKDLREGEVEGQGGGGKGKGGSFTSRRGVGIFMRREGGVYPPQEQNHSQGPVLRRGRPLRLHEYNQAGGALLSTDGPRGSSRTKSGVRSLH